MVNAPPITREIRRTGVCSTAWPFRSVTQAAGRLKMIPFADRAQMKKLADPVMAEYAKEIGADAIYAKINAM